MMLRIGMVFVASALASVAQTSPRSVVTDSTGGAKPAVEDLLRSAQKRFPPEVWSVSTDPFSVKASRSHCVYPVLETRSIEFRRCPPAKKIRLLPPLKPLPKSPAK
jgi:hypothetical protein